MSSHNRINILHASSSWTSDNYPPNTQPFHTNNNNNSQMSYSEPSSAGSYPSHLAPVVQLQDQQEQISPLPTTPRQLPQTQQPPELPQQSASILDQSADNTTSTVLNTSSINTRTADFDYSFNDLSDGVYPRGLSSSGIELTNFTPKISDEKSDRTDYERDDMEISKYDPFDPYNERLYTIKDVGWKGKQTIMLMVQRYMFGIFVAIVVSFMVYIMSLINWSGSDSSNSYLNKKSFHIFFLFTIVFFGPVYILLGFSVSYGKKRIRDSKILYYTIGVIAAIVVFYTILYSQGISYWFYFIDTIGVVSIFTVVEVIFAFNMSKLIQKESGKEVSEKKAIATTFNYCVPDIFVTLGTVVYMFFLLPLYFSIQSDLLRLGWRLVIHPLYWTSIVIVARQFLTRDIATDDIMLNTNIVLHTFFHHQTLGKIFVYTFSPDAAYLTEVGMVIAAFEDILLRAVSLKRDEYVLALYYGREKARRIVYSQQSLELRAAILNIQVGLEFSGLISAPIFIYVFQKWKMLFHFFDSGSINPVTLFYQSVLSVALDLIAESICTFIESKYFKLPLEPTWKWMKSRKWFLLWLVYGSVTMGLFGMLWTCARVPRAGLCSSDDICTCNQIISTSMPSFCLPDATNSTISNSISTHLMF